MIDIILLDLVGLVCYSIVMKLYHYSTETEFTVKEFSKQDFRGLGFYCVDNPENLYFFEDRYLHIFDVNALYDDIYTIELDDEESQIYGEEVERSDLFKKVKDAVNTHKIVRIVRNNGIEYIYQAEKGLKSIAD